MTDTITSDQGTKYDIVEIYTKGIYQTGKYYFQKSSQSSGECNHSFDSALLSSPPIYVCSKCGFQKRGIQSSSENEDKPKELIKELDEAKGSWIINGYEICLIEGNRFGIKGFDRSVSIETLLNTIEDKPNTTEQDFLWIYDCAIAIKEHREEEGSWWTIESIEEIITRHYKNR